MASRASLITPPATSSAAATDTTANAYEVRSRTFRYAELPAYASGGISTAVIRSPRSSVVSRSGRSPGRRYNSPSGIIRDPSGPSTCTTASRAASATAMSEGWVATQCGDPPRMARLRWSPARAGQPEPGTRLLHGLVTSWKYRQRVRCSRLPPTVAMLRSWPDAPASTARASTGNPARTRGSAARSLLRTPAPIRSPPPARGSMPRGSNPVTSTSRSGTATPSFIRSTRLVPPARKAAPGRPVTAAIAAAESGGVR